MTFQEAVKSIERRVETLHIRLRDGTPLPPIVAMGRIGRYHGQRYDHVINSLSNGLVDIDWYYTEMIKMIRDYETRPERMKFDTP